MGTLLVAVLPLALGAAISPTLLALQLLILTGTIHRLARAWALVAGSAVVLAAFSLLCVTALRRIQLHHGHKSSADAAVFLASGILLGALALRSQVRRPTAGEKHTSRIGGRLQTAPTAWFVGVGAVGMVVNFSTLVLVLAAVHEITRATASTSTKVAVYVVMYVIVLVPVLAPVVLAQAFGDRADRALDTVHRWVGDHARTIGTVIEAVFAVYLIVRGVNALP